MDVNSGSVIIIEDDLDDQELIREVFINLKYSNGILLFSDGLEALN